VLCPISDKEPLEVLKGRHGREVLQRNRREGVRDRIGQRPWKQRRQWGSVTPPDSCSLVFL
jgi:hypothetical protein